MHHVTMLVARQKVLPGTLVRHKEKTWRASANVAKGLYITSFSEQTRITDAEVEVFLNAKGEPDSVRQ